MKYRDRIGIIADILNTAAGGAKKTRIMYVANLSWEMLKRYLDETINVGFIRLNGYSYELTEKGSLFLERYLRFSSKYSKLRGELEDMKCERSVLEKMCEPAVEGSSRQLRRK